MATRASVPSSVQLWKWLWEPSESCLILYGTKLVTLTLTFQWILCADFLHLMTWLFEVAFPSVLLRFLQLFHLLQWITWKIISQKVSFGCCALLHRMVVNFMKIAAKFSWIFSVKNWCVGLVRPSEFYNIYKMIPCRFAPVHRCTSSNRKYHHQQTAYYTSKKYTGKRSVFIQDIRRIRFKL